MKILILLIVFLEIFFRGFLPKIPMFSAARKVGKQSSFFGSKLSKGLDVEKNFYQPNVRDFKKNIYTIFPGTKWCGTGHIAKNFRDLGRFSKADFCCRQHDFCLAWILPHEMDYGLTNGGLFVRSHCDCDKTFYECLKRAHDGVAHMIGYTYFTILGPQCFKLELPVTDCLRMDRDRCVEYEVDEEGFPIYQWFDNKKF